MTGSHFPTPTPARLRSRAADADRAQPASARLDPLLLVAAVALIAFSIYTLGVATSTTSPGNPYFYVVRQAIYAVVGIALMLGVARVDYSRFRELRVGIYTAMIAPDHPGAACSAQATRGSSRWIELPFFTFQPSELGKVLLVLALAAFVIDRSPARRRSAQRTVRILAAGARPGGARLHAAGPRHGARLLRDHARGPVRRRGPLDALRAPGRDRRRRPSRWCW